MSSTWKMMRPALIVALTALIIPARAVDVAIGRSITASKTVSINDVLPAGVTSCHPYPSNECCGLLFTHFLDAQRGTLTINRTDHIAGWTQDLHWECATQSEPDMHLPVGFHLLPGGANCHRLNDPATIFARAQFDSPNWNYTSQINMRMICTFSTSCDHIEYSPVPQETQRFLGLPFGTNWHGSWKTMLVIERGGTYTFAKQIGYAESAIAYLNGQEMFRSRCREPYISTTMTLQAGIYDLKIYQMDDGWEDALVFMYRGPDTGNQLIAVPSSKFMRNCAPYEYVTQDTQGRYRCVNRPAPYNRGTGQCNPLNGRQMMLSEKPDENCIPYVAVSTTPFSGTWFSRSAYQVPATQPPPICNGCGYRIRACAPPVNNTWDVDHIMFRYNGAGIDMSFHEVGEISSGWDFGTNHDYHPDSYAPFQAFRNNFNVWRGKADDNGDYWIGIRSDAPVSVDSVQFTSGSCGDRSATWWNARNRIPTFNYTQCVVFEKWNGNAWQPVGQAAGSGRIQPCRPTTISMSGPPVVCNASTSTLLGNGECNVQYDTLSCDFDLGDCRRCTDQLPVVENGGYRYLDNTDSSNSTIGTRVEVICNLGYQVNTSLTVAVCNASDPTDYNSQAYWQREAGRHYTESPPAGCGPLRCLPNSSVLQTFASAEGLVNLTDMTDLIVGQTARFACQNHYALTGYSDIPCNSVGTPPTGGVLAHPIPTCTRLQCDTTSISPPDNGSIENVDANSGGEGITFACDPGYNLVGNSIINCTHDQTTGTWSGSPPTCQPQDCGSFTVVDGTVLTSSTVFGSTATVQCATGKELSSTIVPFCSVNPDANTVSWQQIPQCVDITCNLAYRAPANVIPTANVTLPATLVWGDTVRYTCQDGFSTDIGSQFTMRCGFDEIDNPHPCVQVQCPDPNIESPNEIVSGSRNRYRPGNTIQVGCIENWLPQGDTTSFKCFEDNDQIGVWKRRRNSNNWVTATPQQSCRFNRYPAAPYFRYAYLNDLSERAQAEENLNPGTVFSTGTMVVYICRYQDSQMTYRLTADRTWELDGEECPTTETTQASYNPNSEMTIGGEDSGGSSSTTLIAVIVAVVLILIIVAVVAVVIVQKNKQAANAASVERNFDNPMYDSAASGNFDAPNTGYMDVPGAGDSEYMEPVVGAAGYMDVAPTDADMDDDDI